MSLFLDHMVQDNASLEKQSGLPKAIFLDRTLCGWNHTGPVEDDSVPRNNFFDVYLGPDMVAHTCNLSTWKAELCRSSRRTQVKVRCVSKTKTKAKPKRNGKRKRQKQTNKQNPFRLSEYRGQLRARLRGHPDKHNPHS